MNKMNSPHKRLLNRQLALAWWQASRPPFYIATFIPLSVGFCAVGKSGFAWDFKGFGAILFFSLLLHLASNLANDLFDHRLGIDSAQSIGGSRVIQEGKLSENALAAALFVLYGLALATACCGVVYFKRPALWGICGAAIFSSFFYVAPPIRYGHRALGELSVFCNMGPLMVGGTYYALSGQLGFFPLVLSIPIGLMAAGILFYQSIPELETDFQTGKRTIANLLGIKKALALLMLWWPLVWLVCMNLQIQGIISWWIYPGIGLSLMFYWQLLGHIKKNGFSNLLALDQYGTYVRRMYLAGGMGLLIAIIF